ncbi:MAG: hypothetical protein SVR08_02750 [Spirochaetota bacterium]|nr:hypothetical protein [Spirochaetota bacterium]
MLEIFQDNTLYLDIMGLWHQYCACLLFDGKTRKHGILSQSFEGTTGKKRIWDSGNGS